MNNPILSRAFDLMTKGPARSAWARGVRAYAIDMIGDLDDGITAGWIDADDLKSRAAVKRALLNGAADWRQYSYGGSALCYDGQIARRLCAPWELKRTANGTKDPNPRETWLDVQARALYQAARMVSDAIAEAQEN